MRKSLGILTAFYCLLSTASAQQKNNIKFGKVSPADFEVNSPLVDSNTNAVVLSDVGSSQFEGNMKAWFSIVFKRHKRIKILNKNGFDAATVAIQLYQDTEDKENLEDLKAVTYNLENGAVVATKLERKDILEEKEQKKFVRKKFTFPALKEGSIIEYTYTIKSDFLFNLQPWEFQGEYPCLWSEYEVGIPEFFNYVTLNQGYMPFTETKTETQPGSFTIRSSEGTAGQRSGTLSGLITYNKWAIKDVPALKEESFTSSIDNHITKVEFQLSLIHVPNVVTRSTMPNWQKVTEEMLQSDNFGVFAKANNWLNDPMKQITAGAKTPDEKARKIYEYVRDNFTCTSYYGYRLGETTSLKDVFIKKSGRVGEINLLLLAMLRHENIESEPVLLSLRSRGVVHPIYPLMDRFNYLVCQVKLSSGDLYLDASRPMLGFGKLPGSCYNGVAWVLAPSPYNVLISTDSLKEAKLTSVVLINNTSGGLDGSVKASLGDNESLSLREKMLKTKKEDYSKEIEKGIGMESAVSDLEIDSLKQYEEPLGVRYNIQFKFNDEDVIYFSPLLGEAMKKNPFASATRLYPVEMPYTFDETFLLNMEVPKGYVVDELPQSVRFKFNENEGMFEYIFSKTNERIQMRCRMWMNKTIFSQEDYNGLREFFAFAIKKQGEQIVFKKQKS